MNKRILMDGVDYTVYDYNQEKELEDIIKKDHYKDIFGEDSYYFDIKKKIETITGKKSIPDGFLVNFDNDIIYVIEVELSSHSTYDHIVKQIGKFQDALENYQTRQKIAKEMKDEIKKNAQLLAKVRSIISPKGKDTYQYFLDILEKVHNQNFSIAIIIDRNTKELKRAIKRLNLDCKIFEFRTYKREGCPMEHAHFHIFDSLVKKTPSQKDTTFEKTKPGEDKEIRSEKYDINKSEPYVKKIFEYIVEEMKNYESDIKVNPQKHYVSLRDRKNFAIVQIRKTQLNLIPKLPLEKGKKIINKNEIDELSESVQEFYNSPCFRIKLKEFDEEKLDEVVETLKAAYEYNL